PSTGAAASAGSLPGLDTSWADTLPDSGSRLVTRCAPPGSAADAPAPPPAAVGDPGGAGPARGARGKRAVAGHLVRPGEQRVQRAGDEDEQQHGEGERPVVTMRAVVRRYRRQQRYVHCRLLLRVSELIICALAAMARRTFAGSPAGPGLPRARPTPPPQTIVEAPPQRPRSLAAACPSRAPHRPAADHPPPTRGD